MKKYTLFFAAAFLFAIVGGVIAAGTRNVTLVASGWIRNPQSGGYLLKCGGFAGEGRYYAKITSDTQTLGWMAGATGEALTVVDLTTWESDDDETGFGLSDDGAYLTEFTAAANSFVNCAYVVP